MVDIVHCMSGLSGRPVYTEEALSDKNYLSSYLLKYLEVGTPCLSFLALLSTQCVILQRQITHTKSTNNHSDSKSDLHFEKILHVVFHRWVHQSVIDVAKT